MEAMAQIYASATLPAGNQPPMSAEWAPVLLLLGIERRAVQPAAHLNRVCGRMRRGTARLCSAFRRLRLRALGFRERLNGHCLPNQLERPTVVQPLGSCPAFYGTRRFTNKLRSCSLYSFLHPPATSSLLGPNVLLCSVGEVELFCPQTGRLYPSRPRSARRSPGRRSRRALLLPESCRTRRAAL
jgi:hypothetical protein